MKLKDFIKQEIDIDTYDNVLEYIGIAFCGPVKLTKEGKKHFEEILEINVEIEHDPVYGDLAVVDLEPYEDRPRLMKLAAEFFNAAAGYCSFKDFELWFLDF